MFGAGDASRPLDWVRCVLPVARRPSHLPVGRWQTRYPGWGVGSRGPGASRLGFLRLAAVMGLMPLAARHTAVSPMSVVLRWLPEGLQIGATSRCPAPSRIWPARSATSWDPPDRMAMEHFWNGGSRWRKVCDITPPVANVRQSERQVLARAVGVRTIRF